MAESLGLVENCMVPARPTACGGVGALAEMPGQRLERVLRASTAPLPGSI